MLRDQRNHLRWYSVWLLPQQIWPSGVHPRRLHPQHRRHIPPVLLQDACTILRWQDPHGYSPWRLRYHCTHLFSRDGSEIGSWRCHCGHELRDRVRLVNWLRCSTLNEFLQRLKAVQSLFRHPMGLCGSRLAYTPLPTRVGTCIFIREDSC